MSIKANSLSEGSSYAEPKSPDTISDQMNSGKNLPNNQTYIYEEEEEYTYDYSSKSTYNEFPPKRPNPDQQISTDSYSKSKNNVDQINAPNENSYNLNKGSTTTMPSVHSLNHSIQEIKNQSDSNQKFTSQNSYNTDSVYTHSFHGKLETPTLPGPPPLKRTFLDDFTTDTTDFDETLERELYQKALFVQPDWKFPISKQMRADDQQLLEKLKEKYSVKNIVNTIKHSM